MGEGGMGKGGWVGGHGGAAAPTHWAVYLFTYVYIYIFIYLFIYLFVFTFVFILIVISFKGLCMALIPSLPAKSQTRLGQLNWKFNACPSLKAGSTSMGSSLCSAACHSIMDSAETGHIHIMAWLRAAIDRPSSLAKATLNPKP